MNNIKMSEKQTRKFVALWNKKNNMPQGISTCENMRYDTDGKVYWNVYDSPRVDIKEFVDIYKLCVED
jgi:hypothetical protein